MFFQLHDAGSLQQYNALLKEVRKSTVATLNNVAVTLLNKVGAERRPRQLMPPTAASQRGLILSDAGSTTPGCVWMYGWYSCEGFFPCAQGV